MMPAIILAVEACVAIIVLIQMALSDPYLEKHHSGRD